MNPYAPPTTESSRGRDKRNVCPVCGEKPAPRKWLSEDQCCDGCGRSVRRRAPFGVAAVLVASAATVAAIATFADPPLSMKRWFIPSILVLHVLLGIVAEFAYGRLWPYEGTRFLTMEEIESARAEHDAKRGDGE